MATTSTPPGVRRATRPTVVIGLASLGTVVGFFASIVVGLNAFGIELPDDGDALATVASAGAGIGWLLGAVAGTAASRERRPLGRSAMHALRAGAGVVMIAGVGLCALESWLYGAAHAREEAILQAITLGDAAIAAVTIAAISGDHRPDPSRTEGRSLGAVAIAGIVAGALLFGALLAGFFDALEQRTSARAYRATNDTAWALVGAAERHLRRSGVYPEDLAALLSAGASVEADARVEFAGAFADGFCIVVRGDTGWFGADDRSFTAFTRRGARRSVHVVRADRSCRQVSGRAYRGSR